MWGVRPTRPNSGVGRSVTGQANYRAGDELLLVPTSLRGLEIRRACEADLKPVEAVASAVSVCPDVSSFLDGYYGSRCAVVERIRTRLAGTLIAQQETDLVGFLACGQDEMIGSLGPWAVRPDRQGLGIGSGLLQSMIRVLRARGVRLLEATVPDRPGHALRICRKLGFREYGRSARRVPGSGGRSIIVPAADDGDLAQREVDLWHHCEKRLRG